MYKLQTRHISQEYLTIWWIGCIIFLVGISTSIILYSTFVPFLKRLETMKLMVTGIHFFLPFPFQACLCLFFIAGLAAIVALCRWRRAPLYIFLSGYIPMLAVFLLYVIPQGITDVHLGGDMAWGILYQANRALLLTPSLLLVTGYAFFVLSTVALLRTLWVRYCSRA